MTKVKSLKYASSQRAMSGSKAGLAAGYGIQLVTVFQDTAQMRDLYKGRWASFIGNAGVRALFNLDDFDTAEYWSKFIGGRLVETRSSQQDIYGYSKGDNVGESMRPLLSPDQIMMEFAAGRMLVLAQGAHPIITERVPYWDDTGLNGLWDDPRRPIRPATKSRSAPTPPPPPLPRAPSSGATPNPPPPTPGSGGAGSAKPAPDAAGRPFQVSPHVRGAGWEKDPPGNSGIQRPQSSDGWA